jgi:hypothetical protein
MNACVSKRLHDGSMRSVLDIPNLMGTCHGDSCLASRLISSGSQARAVYHKNWKYGGARLLCGMQSRMVCQSEVTPKPYYSKVYAHGRWIVQFLLRVHAWPHWHEPGLIR